MTEERRLLAACAATGDPVLTQAFMTERRLQRFQGSLFFWCRHCNCAHEASREGLGFASTAGPAPTPSQPSSAGASWRGIRHGLRERLARFLDQGRAPELLESRLRTAAKPVGQGVEPRSDALDLAAGDLHRGAETS